MINQFFFLRALQFVDRRATKKCSFVTDIRNMVLSSLLTYLLTPWSRLHLEKLTDSQLVKKFPAYFGTKIFTTACVSSFHLSFCASSIQSITSHPTNWRSILILSSHLRLGLPSGLLSSLIWTNFISRKIYLQFFSKTQMLVCDIYLRKCKKQNNLLPFAVPPTNKLLVCKFLPNRPWYRLCWEAESWSPSHTISRNSGKQRVHCHFQKPHTQTTLRQINPSKLFHSPDHLSVPFTPGFLTAICKPFSSLPGVSLFINTLPLRNVKSKKNYWPSLWTFLYSHISSFKNPISESGDYDKCTNICVFYIRISVQISYIDLFVSYVFVVQ